MKTYFLTIILAYLGFAQNQINFQKSIQNNLLNQFKENYLNTKQLAIDFVIETKSELEPTWHKDSANIYFAKDSFEFVSKDFRWVSDGKILWKHNYENEQIIIENVSSLDSSTHPLFILRNFLKWEITNIKIQQTYYEIHSNPTNPAYTKAIVKVSPNLMPKEIHLWDQLGSETRYRVLKLQKNKPQKINFNFADSIEIIDMR